MSEDIEGGWLRFWGERRVSEDANISVRLYFISSAAYTAGSFRPAVVFFLAAIASEIQVGAFSALSAMVSLLWGFPSQNLFLLKKLSSLNLSYLKTKFEVCLVIVLLDRMTSSSKTEELF